MAMNGPWFFRNTTHWLRYWQYGWQVLGSYLGIGSNPERCYCCLFVVVFLWGFLLVFI